MDCFAKYVVSWTDPAVRGQFVEAKFIPFTLLAFSGFCDPPTALEVGFLADIMFQLAGPEQVLLVCRNTCERDKEFTLEASRALRRLEFADAPPETPKWQESHCYLIDVDHRAEITILLRYYWNVWYGNWLFADWPADPKVVEEGLDALRSPERRISRVRAAILMSRAIAALTFDDNLFDLYAKCPIDRALAVGKALAQQYSIELRFPHS